MSDTLVLAGAVADLAVLDARLEVACTCIAGLIAYQRH